MSVRSNLSKLRRELAASRDIPRDVGWGDYFRRLHLVWGDGLPYQDPGPVEVVGGIPAVVREAIDRVYGPEVAPG